MKNILMAGAALMLGAAPLAATAQDMSSSDMMEDSASYEMTAAQMASYEGWPANYRTMYDGWPMDRQTSYWLLPEAQQTDFWMLEPMEQQAFWLLTTEQRNKLYAMNADQRGAAWDAVTTQMRKQMQGNSASASNTMGNSTMSNSGSMASNNGQVRYVKKEIVQGGARATQPADYPVCSATVTDSCINPYAAGQRGPKPLDYWPGKPASEM